LALFWHLKYLNQPNNNQKIKALTMQQNEGTAKQYPKN
jgi:hypothetical protein